jgi:hypothetical protein
LKRSNEKDSDLLNPNAPKAGARRRRNLVITLLIITVSSVLVGANFGNLTNPTLPAKAPNTQQWSQWGMSISYPTGLSAQYKGALGQQTTNSSGEVYWSWNRAQTGFGLVWGTTSTSTYNPNEGFHRIYEGLGANATVVQLDLGTATMSGHSWEYRIYSLTLKGVTFYVAVAISYYQSSGREYALYFEDANTNVLSSLEYYGATFIG